MTKQPVVIKSNKYGLTVILDDALDFDSLQEKVAEKFKSSAKFFEDAQMVVSFQGRTLTAEEEMHLIRVITENCTIEIVCLVDQNKLAEESMKRATEVRTESITEQKDCQDGKFYKGTLRSGQVLESETSIIILGDVNPGASVISNGNVVVLGTLKGNIYVGAAGNEDAFVAALSMEPMQVRIANIIARSSDKSDKRKNSEEIPKIAYVEDGNIYIEPITKEVLNDIRL